MNLPLRLDPHPRVPELSFPEGRVDDAAKLRRTLAIVGGFVAILFLLAAFVPIGGAVIGTGKVGVESRVKRIAHPTGGVIAEIPVAIGDHVETGQLLMRLDDRVTGADATYSNLTVEQLLAQRGRLEAERLGTGAIRFPPELLTSRTPTSRVAMEDEQRLFAIRESEEAQLTAQLQARIAQLEEQISGYRAQIGSLRRQRSLIEPERQGVRELWDRQLVTISRMNQLERTAADLDGSIAALQAQIASTRAGITEAHEQAIQLRETRRSQAGQQLAQINTTLNQQQMRSVAAGDQQDRSRIRAPYSGTVEKIAFAAIGDVVRPAEPIMEIVPDTDEMIIEALISPDDVDQVRAGQRAIVRFTSFNKAATPEVEGHVTYVAADRSENPDTQQSFFLARIALNPPDLSRERLNLRSGMPAEVHIQTGSRSLLSYIFKPLRDQFARAFRDG